MGSEGKTCISHVKREDCVFPHSLVGIVAININKFYARAFNLNGTFVVFSF